MDYIEKSIRAYEEGNESIADTWWAPCDCKSNSYFCANLCGYGGKTGKCKHWVDYCETFEKKDGDEEDLF